jgi:hypothetical protein
MRFIIFLLALLFAAPAWAQQSAEGGPISNGCYVRKLCDALGSDGDCNWTSFAPGYSHTLYAEESTDTAFTCTMRSSYSGYSATSDGYGITSPAITVTNAIKVQPFDALLMYYWLNCDKTDDAGVTTVTVYDVACPLTK